MNMIQRISMSAVAAFSLAAAAEGVAFLSDIKGDVALDGAPRPALLTELAKGQRLAVGRDSAAAVMFVASGKEYRLRGPAEYVVKDNEIAGSGPMPPVLRNTEWRTSAKVLAQVAQSSAASVRMRSARTAQAASPLLYPTEGRVATLQPTFRWRAEGAAEPAVFALFVPGREQPVHEARVADGSMRVPEKLAPETEYAWTVSVAGREVGQARFRTPALADLQRIDAHRPSERAPFSDRLLFTLMLHEIGATQEAREAWARLAQERADLPELSALGR